MNKTIPNYNNSLYDKTLYDKVRQLHTPKVRSNINNKVGGEGRGFRYTSFPSSLISNSQQERIIAKNLTLARIFQEEGVDLIG